MSKDFGLLVYSSENKSRILDFKCGKVIFKHTLRIISAKNNENHKILAFIDENYKIYCLKDYEKLIEIQNTITCYQIYWHLNEFKLVLRMLDANFVMLDIRSGKLESKANRLRKLANIIYKKESALISCIRYYIHFN